MATRISIVTSLLFLTTMLVVGAGSMRSFRTESLRILDAEQATLVERIADNLDQSLRTRQRVLQMSAMEISDADLVSSDAAQRYLDRNTGLFAIVDRSTFLFTPAGIQLAERPYRPNRRGSDASVRPYMQDTIKTAQPVISEPFLTNVGDANMVVVMTMPVMGSDGRMKAILTGSLGLTHPGMLGNVAKTLIGRSGHVFIVTADGKLVMHPDKSLLSKRAFAPGENALFERALAGFEGTEETTDWHGRPALVSYRRVPTANWIVGAVYPKEEALLPITELRGRFVGFMAIASAIVLLALWTLTHRAVRPLVKLTQHLARNAHTDTRLTPIHGEAGDGEIHALRDAFNHLAEQLNEREDAVIETMRKYQLITENSADLIASHTPDGTFTFTFASPSAENLLGIPNHALVGRSLTELVHPADCRDLQLALARAHTRPESPAITYRIRHADQEYRWFETTVRLMEIRTTGGSDEILCISRDVSDRKRMEGRLQDLARTDHLTLLPNRFLLDERFANGVEVSRREGTMVALAMIDLDRFKNINDTLGHSSGDALLRGAGSTLRNCLRENDTIVRWGGDEFVLVLPGLQDPAVAVGIVERCLGALKMPHTHDGRVLRVTASAGISLSSDAGADLETMLQQADTAMYQAKSRGGDSVVVYTPAMSVGAESRLSMENALFSAIARDELLLHYQPIISGRTGRIAGVEALVRWRHPEFGYVLPGAFIPIAEASGLINEIGEWVLRTACAQMKRWYAQGLPEIPVSVNLSVRQFAHANFSDKVAGVLADLEYSPKNLELELTESILVDDVERSRAVLGELKALGVSIALDDFGTGYSALSYVRQLPLDIIKIDRAFVTDLPGNSANASILRATVSMARGLGLRTVAEGVETREQATFLIRQGCDLLQGYLFAKPMDATEFLNFALAAHTYLLVRPQVEEMVG